MMSLRRALGFKRFRIPISMQQTYATALSFSTTASKMDDAGERLLELVDLWEDKPSGMFNQLYNARRQNLALRDYFDDGMCSGEGMDYARNYIRMIGYICGKDGVSEIEKQMIIKQMMCWCPKLTEDEIEELCDVGEFEIAVVCKEMNQNDDLPEARTTLLLNALSFAAADGLDSSELEGFYDIAEQLGVDGDTAKKIYSVYSMETELKQKYDELYSESKS